jgi:[acyl-carrier-protein] S-malonyltransferase
MKGLSERIAFVFPGQGAQYPGMGKELYESNPAAREVFDRADAIRPGTSAQCFNGTKEELFLTINTQPCVFCMDLAAAYAVQQMGVTPAAVAGFSLGEVAALTFAQAFDFETGFRLVCRRAEFMQKAAEKHASAMVAVLQLTARDIRELCAEFETAYPVNYTCPGQTVVALEKNVLEGFCLGVSARGGRAVPLAVSAGFHSPFMDEAAKRLFAELQTIEMKKPVIPVYANSTAKPYEGDFKVTLSRHVNSPVYWQKTIEAMIASGMDTFLEVGPGETLCGLIKRISLDVRVLSVENRAGLQALIEMKKTH